MRIIVFGDRRSSKPAGGQAVQAAALKSAAQFSEMTKGWQIRTFPSFDACQKCMTQNVID